MQELEQHLKVFDDLQVGVIVLDSKGLVCASNEEANKIFWKRKDSPVGARAKDLYGDPLLIEALCSSVATHGQIIKTRATSYYYTAYYLFKQNQRKYFVFSFVDENQLGAGVEERFRISEATREVIDCLDEGTVILSPELLTVAVNKSYRKIIGLMPASALAVSADDSNINILDLLSAARKALDTKRPYFMTKTRETREKVKLTANPILVEDEVTMIVCTLLAPNQYDIVVRQAHTKEKPPDDSGSDTSQLINRYLEEEGIVSNSKKMFDVINMIARIAPYPAYVLITGESGTGKEMLANLIHRCSARSEKPFVSVNCAAIPDTLSESEFFGYDAGAFTGAASEGKPGFFEQADGGTLFLDEVGDLSLSLQAKLLRVLQGGEAIRVGGTRKYKSDARIIAATNRNLADMVRQGSFRKDLYYRLKVIEINVPSLRDRPEDIVPLATYFLERYTSRYNKVKHFSPELLDILVQHDWPGNVREVSNVVEQLVLTTAEQEIKPHHLPLDVRGGRHQSVINEFAASDLDLKTKVKLFEKYLLKDALNKYENAEMAAEKLGINRSTLFRKLQ